MVTGIYTASAGMYPRFVQLDALANNLANATTNGFKRTEVFQRRLITASDALDRALGMTQPTDVAEEIRIDFSQGTFEQTGNHFDIAINGQGFFRVRDADGTVFYTRNGSFEHDPAGFIINDAGMYLLDENFAPIQVEDGTLEIFTNGHLEIDGEETAVIGLANFAPADLDQLMGVGMGLYSRPAAVTESPFGADAEILQGFLEDANTDTIQELIEMIELFRIYESDQKVIQTHDQSLNRVVNEVGVLRR